MKLRWILIPVFGIILLVFFIIIIIRIVGGPEDTQTNSTKNNDSKVTENVSTARDKDEKLDLVTATATEKIYYYGQEPGTGVPHKTTADKDFPKVSIYWVKNSVSAGHDTCALYDNNTKQIYFNYYIESSSLGNPRQGKTYYQNDVINKNDATGLIDSLCFK